MPFDQPISARFFSLFKEMRESYWFVPSLMVLSAFALAIVTDKVDSVIDVDFFESISWLYESQPNGARAVLSAIATSMIGVAGVTFSMTIVSVSFAAAHFGPRLIRNFMRDRGNQVTLGTFIATFVYCLLVMRTVTDVPDPSGSVYVPHISLLVALALTLASVAVLIYFIHHIPESLNVGRITSLVGEELAQSVQNLFPEELGSPTSAANGSETGGGESTRAWDRQPDEARCVDSETTGYLQLIDEEQLLNLAIERNVMLRIQYRPGDFVLDGDALVHVYAGEGLDADFAGKLKACFVFGESRTSTQNALFLVDQLVEILARALSPGVNDPFTAESCMHWLRRALTIVVLRPDPKPERFDDDGTLRVVVHPVSSRRFLSAAFDQSRQYVAGDRNAALQMMQTIAELCAVCRDRATVDVLLAHARELSDAGQQCLPIESDRRELAIRYTQTRRIAMDPHYREEMRDSDGWLGGRG